MWAGLSSVPKTIMHPVSAGAEHAETRTDIPTACLWCSTTWNDPRSAYFPLLPEAHEPHSCANQLQTSSWFHWM